MEYDWGPSDVAPSFLNEWGHIASVSQRPSPEETKQSVNSLNSRSEQGSNEACHTVSLVYEDYVQGACAILWQIVDTSKLTEAVVSTDRLAKLLSDPFRFQFEHNGWRRLEDNIKIDIQATEHEDGFIYLAQMGCHS
jgi:hypothetical protein